MTIAYILKGYTYNYTISSPSPISLHHTPHTYTNTHKRYDCRHCTYYHTPPHYLADGGRRERVSDLLPQNLLRLTTTEVTIVSEFTLCLLIVLEVRLASVVRDTYLRYPSYKNKLEEDFSKKGSTHFKLLPSFFGKFFGALTRLALITLGL